MAKNSVGNDPELAADQLTVIALTCDESEVIVGALGSNEAEVKFETTRFPVP